MSRGADWCQTGSLAGAVQVYVLREFLFNMLALPSLTLQQKPSSKTDRKEDRIRAVGERWEGKKIWLALFLISHANPQAGGLSSGTKLRFGSSEQTLIAGSRQSVIFNTGALALWQSLNLTFIPFNMAWKKFPALCLPLPVTATNALRLHPTC